MNKDKIFSFYEKVYFESLSEMNVVLSRFPILIAGVALIISSYVFLFNYDYFLWLPNEAIITITLVILSAVIALLYCLFRTFRGRKYSLIPSLGEIDAYRKAVIEQARIIDDNNKKYPNHPKDEIPCLEEKMRIFIEKEFIESATINEQSSLDRSRWFHRTMSLIWINLCLCIMIPASIVVITVWG